ncbi:MAG: hypothetical protein CVU36_10920 [Betaproteobacteria bacterium HGW-Betaproteobacteria-9]|nr:MAG: hypothetical protein CVU36_10920 [Betaproteobacteria bacterium HGW-Betaproteobacteria-9]
MVTVAAALMPLQSVAQRQTLPLEPQAFELDDQSPTHDFGQGPQPYVLVELPPYQEPYEVRVWNEPKANGARSADQHTRIVPRIFTLKADFSVARSYSGSQLRDRNGSQEKTVFMNPPNQEERFILVFGDKNAQPAELVRSEGKTVFVGTGFFMDGSDNRYTLHPFDKGTLHMEVRGLKPPAR